MTLALGDAKRKDEPMDGKKDHKKLTLRRCALG